jgi:hypothetical protein
MGEARQVVDAWVAALNDGDLDGSLAFVARGYWDVSTLMQQLTGSPAPAGATA